MGAGGRDYHVFNLAYRGRSQDRLVVGFTAAQIPGLAWRRYPPELAGPGYPAGIPIYPEDMLPRLVRELGVDEVVLAYSDLTAEELAEKVALVLSTGARLVLPRPEETMIASVKPVAAVTATKTGAGKSTVSQALALRLRRLGVHVTVVRHPMAYGNLVEKRAFVLRSPEDLDKYDFTLEELEEYEPYVRLGIPVAAGIDYEEVIRLIEPSSDAIIWDGGNNDTPFIRPDIYICVVDAKRPNTLYSYPGTLNVMKADYIIVTKVGGAGNVDKLVKEIRRLNKEAAITLADLEPYVEGDIDLRGRRVVVVEDAPTLTHGGAPHGAGYELARRAGAVVVDPRPYVVGVLRGVYERYPHLGPVLPSMGYTEEELKALEETINKVPADLVLAATPASIERRLKLNKPVVHVSYRLHVLQGPGIDDIALKIKELVEERLSAQ